MGEHSQSLAPPGRICSIIISTKGVYSLSSTRRVHAVMHRTESVCASAAQKHSDLCVDGKPIRGLLAAGIYWRQERACDRRAPRVHLESAAGPDPAPSISAQRAPREESPQSRRSLLPLHRVSEPASLLHGRRVCCSPPEGQAVRGAPAPTGNAAPYSTMSPTLCWFRKRNPNRPLRGRCAQGAASGAGNLKRPVAR
jgi:hypothetical protein